MSPSSQRGESFFARTHFLCMRRCSWWVPVVSGANRFFAQTHFLACEDVAGGSQQLAGESFFCPHALPCVRRCSWWVPAVRGKRFFAKYGGPFSGSPLSGGGIIILRVIRRHFLAAAVDPAVSLSTYSSRLMQGRSLTTLTTPRLEYQGGGR